MTASQGDELRAEADARDRRIEQLELQSQQSRQEMDQKLQELQQVIDSATAVLKRGSADVGATVEQMRQQLATLEGSLAEVRHKVDLMDEQLATQRSDLDQQLAKLRGGKEALNPAEIPADKTAHFQAAYTAYSTGAYEKARALFREYVTRYPTDSKSGEAQYWIGASYTQENKPATALGEYRKVISDFSKSGAVNVALYGMADAFYRLHACTDAKSAIEALLKRKPEKSLSDRAKRLQQEIRSASKKYCTS